MPTPRCAGSTTTSYNTRRRGDEAGGIEIVVHGEGRNGGSSHTEFY